MKKRGTGRKMTLAEAAKENDYLTFHCEGTRVVTIDCGRGKQMNIKDALAQFDPALRLDELPLRCSSCGGRQIDVRADYLKGPGGLPTRGSRAYREK